MKGAAYSSPSALLRLRSQNAALEKYPKARKSLALAYAQD
jgi:hypothetical protein